MTTHESRTNEKCRTARRDCFGATKQPLAMTRLLGTNYEIATPPSEARNDRGVVDLAMTRVRVTLAMTRGSEQALILR